MGIAALLLVGARFTGDALRRGWDVLLVCTALLLSVISADEPRRSAIEFSRFLAAVAVYLAITRLGIDGVRALLRPMIGGLIGLVLVSLALYANAPSNIPGARFVGVTWHPGILGLLSSVTFGMVLAIRTRSRATMVLRAVIAMACLLLIYLADSRTGYLAILLCAGAVIFLRMLPPRARSAAAITLAIAVSVLPLATIAPAVGAGALNANTLQNRAASVSERVTVWQHGLSVFRENWFLGRGYGSDGSTVRRYDDRYKIERLDNLRYYHNWVVNFLANTGIVGFLAISIHILRTVWVSARAMRSDDRYGLQAGVAAFLVILVVLLFAALEGALQDAFASVALWLAFRAVSEVLLEHQSNRRPIEAAPGQ